MFIAEKKAGNIDPVLCIQDYDFLLEPDLGLGNICTCTFYIKDEPARASTGELFFNTINLQLIIDIKVSHKI